MNTPALSPKPASLQMIWPHGRPAPIMPALPAGYTMRTYRAGDKEPYIQLMRSAGFEAWDESKAQGVFDTMHPAGLFFVVHEATGALAATAAAQARPHDGHPNGGELGWVGADPARQGKGLGYAVCAAATCRLIAAGHPSLYLQTDDFRLPAIHIYLKLRWVPFLYLDDMEGRWRAICRALGTSYKTLEKTADPAGKMVL